MQDPLEKNITDFLHDKRTQQILAEYCPECNISPNSNIPFDYFLNAENIHDYHEIQMT